MSIDQLKKQAKNLKKYLPDLIKEHPDGLANLATFQEFVARINGYPHWHAAVKTHAAKVDAELPNSGSIALQLFVEDRELEEFTAAGETKPMKEFRCVSLRPQNRKLLDKVTTGLDDFHDHEGHLSDFPNDNIPPQYCVDLERTCRKLIATDPSFIDGYAHLAIALHYQERFEELIATSKPVYDHIESMLPNANKVRVLYHDLDNRPFFRLAHGLVLAYYGLHTADGNRQAAAVAKRMLKLWPNDNMGFRFLLTPKSD